MCCISNIISRKYCQHFRELPKSKNQIQCHTPYLTQLPPAHYLLAKVPVIENKYEQPAVDQPTIKSRYLTKKYIHSKHGLISLCREQRRAATASPLATRTAKGRRQSKHNAQRFGITTPTARWLVVWKNWLRAEARVSTIRCPCDWNKSISIFGVIYMHCAVCPHMCISMWDGCPTGYYHSLVSEYKHFGKI